MTVARSAALQWGTSFGVVVLIHLVALGTVIWWSRANSLIADLLPADAVMVELAPAPEAPPAPPTDMLPGPPQQQQEQPARTERRLSKPKIETLPLEDLDVQAPDQAQERPEGQPSEEREVQAQAPPSVSVAPSARYAAQQTVSGVQGEAAVTWQAVLLGHLEQHRRYPRQAERKRQEGTAYVRFLVDRLGNVLNPRVFRSSGSPLLDEATLATVRRASPVPPPPPDLAPYPVDVMVPVEFYVRNR